jgi:hypothetical protein
MNFVTVLMTSCNTAGTHGCCGETDVDAGGTVPVLTMDSAVLGLAALGCGCCMVRVFRQKSTPDDAIGDSRLSSA